MTTNEVSKQVAVARLVPYAPGRCIALPPLATLEVLEQPRATAVPGAAAHAIGLLAWRDRHIALVDLAPLLHGTSARARDRVVPYALVVACQPGRGQAHDYAAIALDALPGSIRVGDEDACELPVDGARWPEFATGCFLHAGQPVPIIDPSRLFPWRDA